jgi:hypothetical protein
MWGEKCNTTENVFSGELTELPYAKQSLPLQYNILIHVLTKCWLTHPLLKIPSQHKREGTANESEIQNYT